MPSSVRWGIYAAVFSGLLTVYTLRVNMSVAVQDMKDELGWSEVEKGYVLSSFYVGYCLGQIPASYLTQVEPVFCTVMYPK